MVALTVGTLTAEIGVASPAPAHAGARAAKPSVTLVSAPRCTVLRLVDAASTIRSAPSNLVRRLALAEAEPLSNIGIPPPSSGCWPSYGVSSVPACTIGNPAGTKTMVLDGDSHGRMWFQALDDIATKAQWRLVALIKGGCPAESVSVSILGALNAHKGLWAACDAWHSFAIVRINQMDPQLIVISQASYWRTPTGRAFTATPLRTT